MDYLHRSCLIDNAVRKQGVFFSVGGFFFALQNVWHAKGTEGLCQLLQRGGTGTWAIPNFWKWWVNVRMFWIDLSVQRRRRQLLQVASAHISCSQRFTQALSTATVSFNSCRNSVWGGKLMGSQLWKPTSLSVYEQQNQASLCYFTNVPQI